MSADLEARVSALEKTVELLRIDVDGDAKTLGETRVLMGRIEAKLEANARAVAELGSKLDRTHSKTEARFDKLEARFDRLEALIRTGGADETSEA